MKFCATFYVPFSDFKDYYIVEGEKVLKMSSSEENFDTKFDVIYDKYSRLVTQIALDVLHDNELAKDALQLAFISVTQNMDKIKLDPENEKETKNYISTIAYHAALKLALEYQEIRSHEIPFPEEYDQDDDEKHRWGNKAVKAMSVESLEEMIIRDDERTMIFEAVKKLNKKYSVYLREYFWENMSMSQIAEKHGSSKEAAKKRVYRSVDKLREQFFKEGNFDERRK